MKIIVSLSILICVSFFNYYLWYKLKIIKKFYNYKTDLKTVLASMSNLDTNTLDKLSLSGLAFLFSILVLLLPFILGYLLILKIYSNNLITLILTTLTFLPLTKKSFK